MILREGRFWSAVWRYVRAFPARHPAYVLVILAVLVIIGTAKWEQAKRDAYEASPEGRAEIARQQADSEAKADREITAMMADADLVGLKVWLRDPASAQFTGVRSVQRNGKRVTCGYVNSRNGFGGMAGAEAFAVIDSQVNLSSFGRKAVEANRAVCD